MIKSDGTLHFTGTRKATTKISSHYPILSEEKKFKKLYVKTSNKGTQKQNWNRSIQLQYHVLSIAIKQFETHQITISNYTKEVVLGEIST